MLFRSPNWQAEKNLSTFACQFGYNWEKSVIVRILGEILAFKTRARCDVLVDERFPTQGCREDYEDFDML